MISTELVSSPTSEQKRFAAAYLVSTCDELTGAVEALSPAQASFQRQAGEWCIAEIVEHLAIIEGRVQALMSRLPDATPAEPDRKDAEIDEFIVQAVPRRTSRVQAPEAALPKGHLTLTEALSEFRRKRDDTVRLSSVRPVCEDAPCPIRYSDIGTDTSGC